MNGKQFQKLVKKDRYQVFLLSSPCPFPINFATHNWFVVNRKGKLNRWELLEFKGLVRTPKDVYLESSINKKRHKIISSRRGHVYRNILPPALGVNKYLWKPRPLYSGKLKKYIEGKKGSLAHKMASFIEKHSFKYPLKNEYFLLGPNSNTFIQWIIDRFPESGFKLSWRAIGKSYKAE